MKRIYAVLLMILLLLCVSGTAFAADKTYELKDLSLRIPIPENWHTVTQDTSATDPVFKTIGVDGNELLNYMNENKLYLNAFSGSPLSEIVVGKIDGMEDVYDLNTLSETKLKRLTKDLMHSEEAVKAGITYTGSSLYAHSQAKFIVLDLNRTVNGKQAYGRQYSTIVNGVMINITMHSYDGALTDSQKNQLQTIVEHIGFTKITKKPGLSKMTGVLVGIVGFGGVFLYALHKRRKTKELYAA